MSVALLDFWAEWCGPCRLMNPVLEEVNEQFQVIKVNVDENPDKAKDYNIRGIPTFVIVKDGKELDRIVGATTKQKLLETLEKHNESN